MRIQIQQLKKEVSRLRGLVDGAPENKEHDIGAICFPGSPGSFKWETLQGSFSPLTSSKKTAQKKEYEAALIGAFKRERDKEVELQALAAENQAAMHLAKKREDEIQGLKMRLRFREAGIKRLEAVASGKISAETHLLQEKEEYLKEIEGLRNQVDRNLEVTRFAMENLQLKEELRRLKSFCEEGEREQMNEQIMTLQNKLLEALDWKLMNESDSRNVQNGSSDLEDLEDSLLSSNKEPRSAWCSASIKEENEFLRLQAIQNQSEMESLRRKLNTCMEEKENLERRIGGLAEELEEEKRSAKIVKEAMKQLQLDISRTARRDEPSSDVTSNVHELETMVGAIAAASQREAEAHEIAITLGKENDDLRAKLKATLEDNKKLIELYEVAAAEVSKAKEFQSNNGLAEQLHDMHEENEKLLGLYEKAMQERDEYKRRIFSSGQTGDIQEDINCMEKLVVMDTGEVSKCDEFNSRMATSSEDTSIDGECQLRAQADSDAGRSTDSETKSCNFRELSEELVIARNKLETVPDKLANVGEALKLFQSLEKMLIEVDRLARDIEVTEEGMLGRQQEIAEVRHLSSQMQNKKLIVENKLSALKSSVSKISSSIVYWEQRELRARERVDSSRSYVDKKTEALVCLQAQVEESETAVRKAEESELELRDHIVSLSSKLEKENLKKESQRVLLTIENLDRTNISAERSLHFGVNATELLKAEEERTKLKYEMKQYKERLNSVLKEIEGHKRRAKKVETEIHATENDIVTGLQSVKELEFAYQNVIQEKEMLKETSENGLSDVQDMIVEYHQCVFGCDLKDSEVKILEQELEMENLSLEELRANMIAATQSKTRLLDDTRRFLMAGSEQNHSLFVSDKVEEALEEVRVSVSEAKSLLDCSR